MREFGRASGRRSRSHRTRVVGCVKVFRAWPLRPWIATMLVVEVSG